MGEKVKCFVDDSHADGIAAAKKCAQKVECCHSCHDDDDSGKNMYGENHVYAAHGRSEIILYKACCCSRARAFSAAFDGAIKNG